MVLTAQPHLICCFHDIYRVMENLIVEVIISPDRPFSGTFILVFCRHHRIHLNYELWLRHVGLPLHSLLLLIFLTQSKRPLLKL